MKNSCQQLLVNMQWSRSLVLALFLCGCFFSSNAQFTTDKNHVVSYTARKSGLTSLTSKPKEDVAVSVQYMDRLGRPVQSTAKEASPNGKDIISFNEYDSYGLESKQYMPYVGTTTNALYINLTTAKSAQASFYNASSDKIANDAEPWSTTTIERSPFKRVINQNSAGSAWQSKLTEYEYTFNTGSEVLEWEITDDGDLKLSASHYYPANELSVVITELAEHTSGTDYTARTYTNYLGQTILQRSYKGTEAYDTYNVFDEDGNLRFIIPPKAVKELLDVGAQNIDDSKVFTSSQPFPSGFAKNTIYYYTPGTTVTLPATMTFSPGFHLKAYPLDTDMVADLLYVNEYDDLNRLVSKKVPGAEPVYYVYDPKGRLILSQDGNQRNNDQWTFTKYDQYDRPILTGVATSTQIVGTANAFRTTAQNFVTTWFNSASKTNWYEKRGSVVHGYTSNSFPVSVTGADDYLVVSYYDDYDFKSSWGSDFNFDSNNGINNGPNIPIARGLETGGKIKVLGESKWLKSVKYYDYDLQLIQGISGPYTGEIEKVYSKYNFTGDLTESEFTHKIDGSKTISIHERYEYDFAGRLEKQYHRIDSEPEILIAAYEYNELGELVDKQLHSTDQGTTYVQSVDYRYNIKGWLTNINKSDRTNFSGDTEPVKDLFGMDLYYNTDPSGLNFDELTNGNLAGVTWGHADIPYGSTQRSYKYSYNSLNQLTAANYQEKSGTWTNSGYFDVSGLVYDHNGNIKTLQRKSDNNTIDNLTYDYDGNQLKSIDDVATTSGGFDDGAEGTIEYTYDANGNMITDDNKLITSITYNILNKPEQITFSSGDYIKYTYDAAGTKLKQEVWINSALSYKTEYSSGLIFEDGVPALIAMPQGRIIVDVVGNDYNYDYQYFLTDHLGNNRAMVAPQTRVYEAGMESENSTAEEAQFLNLANTREQDGVYNHTTNGDESARLNTDDDLIIGPAKGLKVYAGDIVDMSVYAKHPVLTSATGQATANVSIFSAIASAYGVTAGGETADLYSAFNSYYGAETLVTQDWEDDPAAYLNYIFFDSNYQNPVYGFKQISGAAEGSFEQLTHSYTSTEEGYLFIYVSNESSLDVNVYFDDFEITHTSKASIFQADDYYPFGLPITSNQYQQTGNKENRFLYQGKEWQTDLALNLYDFHARQYDPAIGQFTSRDPKDIFGSPYLGMGNNPIMSIDPDGEEPLSIGAAIALGALLGGGGYTASVAFSDGGFDNWNWGSFIQSVGIGAASGAATLGIGNHFGHSLGSFGTELGRATAHGLSNTVINGAFGNGISLSNFASGAGGSLFGSGMKGLGFTSVGATIASSAAFSGGVAELTGGDFWRGAATGATVSALNHFGETLLQQRRRQRLAREMPQRRQFARKLMAWKRGQSIDFSGLGSGSSLAGLGLSALGDAHSLNLYGLGFRRGVSGNYRLTGRNLSLFGGRAMTGATRPLSGFTSAGRMFSGGGTVLSAIGTSFDIYDYSQGNISGGTFGYRITGTGLAMGAAYFAGAEVAVPLSVGSWAGEQVWNMTAGFRSAISTQYSHFYNALRGGWRPSW